MQKIAPKIAAPVNKQNVPSRAQEVLKVADDCNVSRTSLVALAALSSIYAPQGLNPAKGILKPKADYSVQDSYNALVDLRSLETLIYTFALFPTLRTILCTADKSLALFWSGIGASNFERTSGGVSFNVTPHAKLFGGRTMTELHEYLLV